MPTFALFDSTRPPLRDSPSPLHADEWLRLLRRHPGDLGSNLHHIITYGAQLGYNGPDVLILSDNLKSSLEAPSHITDQLRSDLKLGRVSQCVPRYPYISSPLGLVSKSDGGWRRIHHLSHPPGRSVNDYVPRENAYLAYTSRVELLHLVVVAGRGAVILKRDLKDAFRMIAVAQHQRWLLGFSWNGVYYHENCLSFGLRTAPFIFNLFAEGFHWVLQCALMWLLIAHYLDDFIMIVPHSHVHHVPYVRRTYVLLTTVLGLVNNDSKSTEGTEVECLGVLINTVLLEARLPSRKLEKALRLVLSAISAGQLSLNETEQLTGFLSFCTVVVRLGRTHLRRLWSFQASFHNPRAQRPITASALEDLYWWRDLLPQFNGIHLLDDTVRPIYHLFTDASDLGQAGFWYVTPRPMSAWKDALPLPQEQAFSARWLPHQTKNVLSINVREIIAIATAVSVWGTRWARGLLLVHTDNTTAESAFDTEATKNSVSMDLLREALLTAASLDIVIRTRRVSSEDNALADALSRFDTATIADICPHWQLSPSGTLPLQTSSAACFPSTRTTTSSVYSGRA